MATSDPTAPRADELFRLAFDHAPDAMFVADERGRFIAVNQAGARLLDHAPEALVGRPVAGVFRAQDAARLHEELAAVQRGQGSRGRWQVVRRDGGLTEVDLRAHRLPGGLVCGVVREVEPDDRAARQLEASWRALRSLVDALPSPAFILDRNLDVVMCNDATARVTRRSIEAVVGHSVIALLPPAVITSRVEYLRAVMRTGLPRVYDAPYEGRQLRIHMYPVGSPSGLIEQVAVLAIDVSDARRAEAEARVRDARLRATIDGTPAVAVQWYDVTGRVRLWNRASERMFGFSADEAIGKRLDELILAPDEFAAFMQTLAEIQATGTPIGPVEYTIKRRDGTTGTSLSTTFAIPGEGDAPYFVCMDVDVTERKRVEAQLRQAQKEEVIGRLAGGLAHDFNNLLTAIIGFSELGLAEVAPDAAAADCLRSVLESARRGAALTGNLLAFARRKPLAPREVVLRDVVDRLLPLMRPLLGERIELVTRHQLGDHKVKVDVGGVEQVVMNLVVNARDAMPRGGRLVIVTRVCAVEVEAPGGPPAGRWAVLEVSDTGHGVPPELRERVFEPFFTTKTPGHGTGLGLATCATIVRQAHGHIGFESGEGGTRFVVHLPVVASASDEGDAREDEGPAPAGDETVLVAEDEAPVRRLLERVLTSAGYRVLAAEGGPEALALAVAHVGPIHLLVSDVRMPRMSGPELAEALTTIRPEVAVLLVTGYAADALVPPDRYPIVEKPFSSGALLRRVRELLDARPAPAHSSGTR